MGLFKRLKNSWKDIVEDEFPEDYEDDGKEYYEIPEKYEFTYSSVKGDFRLHAIPNGFCTAWKDFIVARDWDGNFLYRIDGFGRSVALNDDKTKLVAVSDHKQIAIFDAATGEMISDVTTTAEYLQDLLWTKNNHIVASDADSIFVMDENGIPMYDFKSENGEDFEYISGICPDFENDDIIIVGECNGRSILKVNYINKSVEKREKAEHRLDEIFYSEAHEKYYCSLSGSNYVDVYDEDIDHLKSLSFEGKEGVQYVGQPEFECTCWTILPALSPDGRRFLVNDKSGLLMLISAHSDEEHYRTFTRNLIDHAYAMIWQDNDHFVTILDRHRVVKMNIRGTEVLFDKSDIEAYS